MKVVYEVLYINKSNNVLERFLRYVWAFNGLIYRFWTRLRLKIVFEFRRKGGKRGEENFFSCIWMEREKGDVIIFCHEKSLHVIIFFLYIKDFFDESYTLRYWDIIHFFIRREKLRRS